MPLEIAPDVFKWLQGLSLAKQAKRNQNNFMQLNEQESSRLMDGYVFGNIFRSLFKSKLQEEKFKKLDSLKEHSTPAIRLYNWGILAELLKQVGYNLDYADKSKITNYEPEPLAKVLNFLFEVKSKDPTLKQPDQNALKVDINEIGKKTLQDATNSLQFLTISISKNFKISPQQTLNLFLDNNKYLSHLLVKGVKNSYEPIHNLLGELFYQAEFIIGRLFCLDEEINVNFMLNAIKSCLISKDERSAEKCCNLLLQIYEQYKTALLNLDMVRKWVQTDGIHTLLFCIKKHPSLSSIVFTICFNFLDDEFFKYVQLSQKSVLWNSEQERFSFYKTFVEEVNTEILSRFALTNYFQDWNKLFLKTMKKTKDKNEMLLLVAIMQEQWSKLEQKFEQNDLGLPNQYINFLRNVIMTPNQLLFLQSSRTLFSLMKSLGSIKNPFAPLIYKILVTAYTTFSDISKIVYMSENFIVSFKGITGLPGNPLVLPLLKHLQNNKQLSVIELTSLLIEQKRIDEDASLDLIEMMTKIAFSDIRFGSIVLDSIFSVVQYVSQDNISGFIESNSKTCLAQLYSLSKGISKSVKHLKQELQGMKSNDGSEKAANTFITAASKHIFCQNMIGFISKSIYIDEQLKRQLEPSVFHTYIKIKVQLKKPEQAELLRPIMMSYYPQEDDLEAKIAEYMKEAFPPAPQPEIRRRGHSHVHLSKSVTLKAVQAEEKEPVIIDPAHLKPSSFAVKDLEKAKQKRYDLKTMQVQRQKQKAIKEEKIQKFKTIQHEKRLVQSMSSIKNDVEYKNIQTLEPKAKIEPQTHQSKELPSINIKLLNLEKQQQDPYKQDVESVYRRYKKVWRYLFYKYSTKKTDINAQEKVHQGQAWKMLKQYQFNFLKKEECFTVVRLINQQMKRKNDIQFLTYEGFQDFLLQMSVLGFGKMGYNHMPPGKLLHMLVEQLKKVTKDKSGSVEIFDTPQEAYFQETQVIRQYNKRLKQNSDYILPEGYKKIKQTSLEFQYDFHPMLQKNISSSYIDVIQVLDSIFSKNPKLGFHIVEPLSIKSQSFLAKPFLFQNISQKMKDYNKGYLQPKRSISAANGAKDTINLPSPPPLKKQFKPYVNFSLGIKMGIAETSIKNKSIAQEVAYCMEDILNAVENQSTVVTKGKKKIFNDFMKRKRAEVIRISTQRKKDDVDWKKRADSVKLEVEALRQKRKQTDKVKKKRQFVDRRTKKQKEERLYKIKMKEFQKAKEDIQRKKDALMQLKEAEEEKTQKQKEQYKSGVQQYFKKKKDEIRQREEEYKRKKEEQKYQRQEKEQLKKEFAKRLYLSNLKRQEEVLEKVDEIKQNYDDVWKSSQIQQVLAQSKKSLKLLFDLLLKYEKSKISATNYDEIGLATLTFFTLKFKIMPFMLQKQDVQKIFAFATKGDEDKKVSRKGINFDKFIEVIFLISTKAKKMLNKMIQKRRKKEQKIQAFLNAQKSSGGNHFQAQDVQGSDSDEEQSQEEKPTLQDGYLFNAEDVQPQTLEEVITFLRLPADKQDMQERYKQALEVKTSMPKKMLIKEIKQTLDA